jgi:hypothetical protein
MRSQEIFTSAPYFSSTSFSIPVSSDVVYFFSRGSFGYGSLRFELSDKTDGDIDVEISLDYYHEEILKRTQVCLLERKPGERGVGFFVSNLLYPWSIFIVLMKHRLLIRESQAPQRSTSPSNSRRSFVYRDQDRTIVLSSLNLWKPIWESGVTTSTLWKA